MIELIEASDYKAMPWKNGLGTTAQIDIFPERAAFPGDEFQWRLSSAKVATSSEFSLFPKCDRWLMVWKGNGLRLNKNELRPFSPFQFSGEEKINAELLNDEVVDIGLIYRRDLIFAEMKLEKFSAPSRTIHFDEGFHYIICLEKSFKVADYTVKEGDTLKIDESPSLEFLAKDTARYLHISLKFKA
jgi:Uncharacterized protein conserved in bacteria